MPELKEKGCEITAIFCLNSSFASKGLTKAKAMLDRTKEMVDSWLCRCLNTRENLLAYFSKSEPISVEMEEFPLPPAFDVQRKKAISVLDACEEELVKTLANTKSGLEQNVKDVASLSAATEEILVQVHDIQRDISSKQSIQQTKAEFISGQSVLTGGALASHSISVVSPCEKSWLGFVTHNCSLKPPPQSKSIVGNSVTLSIVPDWIAIRKKEICDRKWHWFAQVWLEYSGEELFANEIAVLKEKKKGLKTERMQVEYSLQQMQKQMAESGKEAKQIACTLEEIHATRNFLKRAVFPIEDFQLLEESYPWNDIKDLIAAIASKNNIVTSIGPGNAAEWLQGEGSDVQHLAQQESDRCELLDVVVSEDLKVDHIAKISVSLEVTMKVVSLCQLM